MNPTDETLSRAKLDQLLEEGAGGLSVCRQDGIEIDGRKLVPDETKGYIEFKMSHGFPVVTAYGQSIHPNVVQLSHQSLRDQPLNWEHVMVAYDKDRYRHDKILGTVVAAEFPRAPMGGTWKVSRNKEDAPAIRAAAAFAKRAQGMANIIGQHLGGKRRFTVSMEVEYPFKDCAFAVALNGQTPKHDTPDDMVEAGWELIPWLNADNDLLSTFSVKKNRIISDWKGRKVVQLMGGIDKPIHYAGVAIVQFGAENEAEIMRMAASSTDENVRKVLQPLFGLAGLLTKK